jgi:hypothetical protein
MLCRDYRRLRQEAEDAQDAMAVQGLVSMEIAEEVIPTVTDENLPIDEGTVGGSDMPAPLIDQVASAIQPVGNNATLEWERTWNLLCRKTNRQSVRVLTLLKWDYEILELTLLF